MAKLTAATRKKLKTSEFALPDERKYPIQDKKHAVNAKGRVVQQFNKGNISATKKATVVRKANAKLRSLGVKPGPSKKASSLKKTTKKR